MTRQANMERYTRQVRLNLLGEEGQQRLLHSSVLVVGCGALGGNLANLLARAGVGRLRVVDRDVPELNNLQRQVLFDEQDVAQGLPKAEAAARKLRMINSTIQVDPHVADVTPANIEQLMGGVDLVLDGTDNFETRYLINDACIKHGLPWIYGGVVGTSGMTLDIIPAQGPCLRCLFPDPPTPGSLPTCETQGILGTAPALIAALQVTEAIKLLSGGEPSPDLLSIDLWTRSLRQVKVLRNEDCPACGQGKLDFLSARQTAWVSTLCGRNTIQITPAEPLDLSLERLSQDLAAVGQVKFNGLILSVKVDGYELNLFPDGRVMIKGTTDEAVARGLVAKYVGV